MMRSFLRIWFSLISGITNLIYGCILHAEELSITTAPTPANLCAHSIEVAEPAENRTMFGFAAIASSIPITLYVLPRKLTSLPTERLDATGKNSVTRKVLSSRTFTIALPTKPVAPTIATFIGNYCKKAVFNDFGLQRYTDRKS